MSRLVIKGDSNVPDMPLKDSEINHLRRLLAWMRCEWCLEESAPLVIAQTARSLVDSGAVSESEAVSLMQDRAERMNQVPLYVRQALKMLTKALRDHERRSGVVDSEG